MRSVHLVALCALASFFFSSTPASSAEPLRVFLRGGAKTHGPASNGLHDHPRFVGDYTQLLAERGVQVSGGMSFPTGEQLAKTDVLVMFAAEAGSIAGEDRDHLDSFLKRGGGIVCLHDAVCGTNAQWFKTIIGGAWEHGRSKWFEGPMSFYYLTSDHEITAGCSNFDVDDELYWDLHMMPEAKILASTWIPDKRNTREGRAYPHIYETAPQMWTYERTLDGGVPYRAFVSIPGHKYSTFQLPNHRAVILRGIAWAGHRPVDSLCKPEELATLRYPEGGPTSPDNAGKKLETHPEFTTQLVASEPLITKPIAIDWDTEGRLWVAETPEYPNGRRGIRPNQSGQEWKDHGGLVGKSGLQDRPARDRLSILTDSNGDGIMDKKTVWYEGLELVTGFVFHRDGVIACAAPDIFWIRDRDHDGKADEVVKLYTGLGNSDTHAVINNLRWGMDGWIYATHGYSAGEVKSADGSKSFGRMGSGVVRFRPDGSAFEQYSSKGGNTWGLDFTWDGDLFFTQPTSGDLLMTVLMPENILSKVAGAKVPSYQVVIRSPKSYPLMKSDLMAYVQIDWVGSFTAAAGAAIYGGGSWPSTYNGHYFTTEPTINIIHHEAITRAGTGYQGSKLRTEEFIGSKDLWFRPIETRIGPDGALYLLDFYNQAVIHNDTRGPAHNNVNAAVRPDRDHYFGRIWRVNHRDARVLPVAKLRAGKPEDWIAALDHPNRAVRMNAHRLLSENPSPQLGVLASDPGLANAATRIHSLWLAERAGLLKEEALLSALASADDGVRKTGLRIVAQRTDAKTAPSSLQASVSKAAKDGSPAVRLQALIAMSQISSGDAMAKDLVEMYPSLGDPWLETAAQAAAASAPLAVIKAALASPQSDGLNRLITMMGALVATSGKADSIAELITLTGDATGHTAIQRAVLESLATSGKSAPPPPWTEAVKSALTKLLASEDAGLRLAVLPLIERWDTQSSLADAVKQSAGVLLARLRDTQQSDLFRKQAITGLLSIRKASSEIVPAILTLLGSQDSAAVQSHAIKALIDANDPAITRTVVEKFAKLPSALQGEAFDVLLKRPDSSMALLEALDSGAAPATALGPANLHRLRYHPDASVAKRAVTVIEKIRGPEAKEKQGLITKLTPEITQPGDVKVGHQLFVQNCAVCHRFNEEGKDVGPALTGMGAHGAAELLVHILDPNREVDPSFSAWNFETKDGESYEGIVGRENRSAIFLKSAAGEMELKRDQIRSQRNTGRSLMPEGFEALGAAGLRDLLSFITEGDARFRVLDLKSAFTADSSKGLYNSIDQAFESLHFKRFGMIQAGSVPFEVVPPTRGPGGRNVIVLKGGTGYSKTMPSSVEIPAPGVTADRLHFLGGVAGWGYPCCGENQDLPAAKITIHFADGKREELLLKNGQEIADYNGMSDVPGSTLVKDLVPQGSQVRWFTKRLQRKAELAKIVIQSFDNLLAPTFVAITAEAGDPSQPRTIEPVAAVAPTSFDWGSGIRTLLVGGGSSHDFNRWFNLADLATLKAAAGISPNYTEKYRDVIPALKQIDVLGWSANQPQNDPELRKALLDYADSGKGLVLIHPGNWYIWNDWPEWNKILVGGGSKSHDRYGEFEVTVTAPNHPLMAGVPATFRLADELYHMNVDPQATPIEVLATGKNLETGKTWPLVWITKHPHARIVNITLGHDGQSHDNPAYKQLLKNAVTWASKKPLTAGN